MIVVGLGPGDERFIVEHTRALIAANLHRFVRTRRHPGAGLIGDAVSFDDEYETAGTFGDVYTAISDRLVAAAAEHGQVLYAVPGSPLVLERSVEELRARTDVDTEVHPAMSFLDVAWSVLGVDPVDAGVRLVDGHRFATEAAGERGPLLVAHCHNQRVLSDIKLSVEDPGDEPVVVLQRLGTVDESVSEVSWWDLDREVDADHLTSLYIPALASPVAVDLQRFAELVSILRRECPWDSVQTHQSLRRHLIEESYELIEAIDALPSSTESGAAMEADVSGAAMEADMSLCEELGDVLFQVFIHSEIAAQQGRFTLADVARGVHDKLRDRHPHVFGDASADDLVGRWEHDKRAEKARDSVFDGIAAGLPALSFAAKVQRKATALGVVSAFREAGDHVIDADGNAAPIDEETMGATLFAVVEAAIAVGVDAEDALRLAAERARDRARRLELDGADLSVESLQGLVGNT
ncbi:MAG: SAM-dependent methyltransferase [Acidimicrobiia bacterium]|nr:SAM-dependent methyltransferase [Acidimicrobiia bacterium]